MLSALLVGAASVSQAGVRFGVELGFPLPGPRLADAIISHPAPVYDAKRAAICTTPETTVYQAPACPTPAPGVSAARLVHTTSAGLFNTCTGHCATEPSLLRIQLAGLQPS